MLWAHPRSRSTAFERAFMERGDCTILHEPLSKTRYHGADPAPLLAAIADPVAFTTSPLLDDIRHTPPHPVYGVVKDMPSHTTYSDAHLASFTHHILLVRDPAASIRSYHAVDPTFLSSDAGYAEVLALGRRLVKSRAQTLVVETDTFASAPEETLRRVCEFLGIPYVPAMVSWEARRAIPAWRMWTEFHKDALESTSIAAQMPNAAPLPAARIDLIAELQPIYRDIVALQNHASCRIPTLSAGGPLPPVVSRGLVDKTQV
jgi:hypothetical protein